MNPIILSLIKTGIPTETLYILLLIPIIATLIIIARQVIGIITFDLYIVAFSVISLIAIGSIYGIIILAIIIIFDTIIRYLIKPINMHYIAKTAISISIISLIIIYFLYLLKSTFGINSSMPIYPILILILLTNSLSSNKIKKGDKKALLMYIESIIFIIIIYFLTTFKEIQTILFEFPYISILAILLDLYLGKITSLRLSEIIKFKDIVKDNG
ncbi:hypothetical protein M1145_01735 [Patescibacteria group bacterium]|nr:hypothetical protein [Patescibacteria group bacterium]